jgi:outer membrane protein assembly factor BamA
VAPIRTATALAAWALLALAGCRAGAGGEERAIELAGGGRLRVRFEGRRALSERELRQVVAPDLETAARRSSLRAVVDDAAYSAEVHYRRRGFPACAVEHALEPGPDGDTLAVLRIAEGPRVRIGNVRFVRAPDGDAALPLAFDERELRSFVLLPRRLFLPDPEPWYVAEELESARAAVETYYRSRGWLAAEVRLLEPRPEREEWPAEVEVVLEVREGALHRLRSLRVEGGLAQVEDGLDLARQVGQIAVPRLPASLRSQLREAYARRGYPEAEVRVVERTTDAAGHVDLVLAVEPGPHVVLGQVRVSGHARTREARIRVNF